MLRYVLQYATEVHNGDISKLGPGFGFVVGIFVLNLSSSILTAHSEYQGQLVGIQARAAAVALVYKKSMRISSQAQREGGYDKATIMNLAGAHANRLYTTSYTFHYMCAQVFCIPLPLALMIVNLGYSPLAGVAVLFLVMPFQAIKVSQGLSALRQGAIEITTKRSAAVLSTLSGIRFVKYFAWERMFSRDISKIRWDETHQIRKIHTLDMGNHSFNYVLLGLVPMLMFITYNLTGHTFSAPIVFSTLALWNVLREDVKSLSWNISLVGHANISVRLLESFLAAEERPSNLEEKVSGNNSLQGASFTWETTDGESPFQLHNLNLNLITGLNVVVGPVASGKSSLLNALTGEMRKTAGTLSISGRKAFCSQTPWIRNASVRENITFGSIYEETWYAKVIHACALETDFKILPSGDQTEIGELGINLSGGQKARINFARAIYSNADLIIADDVRPFLLLNGIITN